MFSRSYRTLVFVIFILLLGQQLRADEARRQPMRYQLSICAFFKNEARYLKEWIEYHRLIGVDHFYLYNNGSTDDFKRVLNPYVRKGVVTLVNWPTICPDEEENCDMWMLGTKMPAFENAA